MSSILTVFIFITPVRPFTSIVKRKIVAALLYGSIGCFIYLRIEDLGKRPPASIQALIESKAVYFFVRL
jgi:hypothetical protein